ncbi:MAG: hybrid sensor histidine kinase/response regulator [Spirochaetia bacterium]|nr:hybrid sensor histidine kinase/response regulator [Spirochaetia bacterium]
MAEDKKTILVVDDTAQNIKLVGNILDGEGYLVRAATDGKQALAAAEKSLPDLILLDVMMPEMDGFETCQALKAGEKTKEIPVIFLTAKNDVGDIARAFEIGAVDYVAKPFNSVELLARVKTHIDLQKAREAISRISNERKELLHILCHDLTNPIGFVMNVIQLEEAKPGILQEMKETMLHSMQNSLELIQRVRTMMAVDENKLSLTTSLSPLDEMLKESLAMLDLKVQKKQIQIELDLPEGMMVRVERTTFINSVINNILTNSIKFSDEGGTIQIFAKEAEGRAELSIKDQGIGMSESLIHDLFDITKKTSRKGTAGEVGTGFGMPLVMTFVRGYGGDIRIVSSEQSSGDNHGTEIIIILKAE